MQITLTSDMGNQNPALAVLRSTLLDRLPEVNIIDITHDIPLGMHIEAVYHLKSSLYYFPKNSIHVVLVDLFHNLDSFLLIAQYKNQYYIAPNNGILSMLLKKEEFLYIKALPLEIAPNNIIHTQVLFNTIACAAKKLETQNPIETFTNENFSFLQKKFPRAIPKNKIDSNGNIYNTTLTAHIIFIDHFGNLVINLNIEEFLEYQKRNLKIVLKERYQIHTISKHYNDVPRGDLVAFFNTNGFLEIGINGQSLSKDGFVQEQININNHQFSIDLNDYYKTVRIEFFD
ncbi:MAG: SAM hydrolase/SAM-dependent halogenase family protein [Chitinophagaceae bacterium]